MFAEVGQPMRGYRPSRFGLIDEDHAADDVRLANLEVYAKRASEGLPIFDEVLIASRQGGTRRR